jgi:hypothetical protein
MPNKVIVRRAAVAANADPYDLVGGVVQFVFAMQSDGLYSRSELPAKALQAYDADFYLAQINNGGHSQFIHNCHDDLSVVVANARAGLIAMGAQGHISTLEAMTAWIAENPGEASDQTGFDGGRASFLDELDRQFYEADKAAPMVEASARWIAAWPELSVVEDAAYDHAIVQLASANPHREAREVWTSVKSIRTQTDELFYVGVGLACAQAGEMKLGMGGGWFMDIEGVQQMTYMVKTSANTPRQCVVAETHSALYEFVRDKPLPMQGRAGKKLSYVKRGTIDQLAKVAIELEAAAAIDLLLRRRSADPTGAAITPKSCSGAAQAEWYVVVNGETLSVRASPERFALHANGGGEPLVTIGTAEVQAHAGRAAAGEFR